MSKKQEFEEGGLWERRSWEMVYDYQVEKYDCKPCRHAKKVDEPHYHDFDGKKIDSEQVGEVTGTIRAFWTFHSGWVIPRVVVAVNEGGYDSTGVCADCIVEAVGESQ